MDTSIRIINKLTMADTKRKSHWKRPKSVAYPSTWLEFEGKVDASGVQRKYWIQDMTKEHLDWAMEWLVNGLLKDEPLCKYTVLEKKDMDIAKEFWKYVIKEKLSLICLTKDAEGKTVMAGFNFLYLAIVNEKKTKIKSAKLQNIFDIMEFMTSQRNAFEELKIDEYLGGLGLYVLPNFRGEALGLQLLKARIPMCKALGIKSTITIFSSFISQKLAARCGFTDFWAMDYDEIIRINPHFYTGDITEHTKTCKNMCLMIDTIQ